MGFFSKVKKKLKKVAKSVGHAASHPLDVKAGVKALKTLHQETSLSHNVASGSAGKAILKSSIDFNRQLHNAKVAVLGKKGAAIEEQIGSAVGSTFTFGGTDAAKAIIARKTGRDPHSGQLLYAGGSPTFDERAGGQSFALDSAQGGNMVPQILPAPSTGFGDQFGAALDSAGRILDSIGGFNQPPILSGPDQEDVQQADDAGSNASHPATFVLVAAGLVVLVLALRK